VVCLSATRTDRLYTPGSHLCQRMTRPQSPTAAEKVDPIKTPFNSIEIQTCDLVSCNRSTSTNLRHRAFQIFMECQETLEQYLNKLITNLWIISGRKIGEIKLEIMESVTVHKVFLHYKPAGYRNVWISLRYCWRRQWPQQLDYYKTALPRFKVNYLMWWDKYN
jgi:hypothetical protein